MKNIEQKITKLLCQLIETKSLSKEEEQATTLLSKFFKKEKIKNVSNKHKES